MLFFLCLLGYGVSLDHAFMLDDYVVLFNESGVANKSFPELFKDYQHIFSRPVGHLFLWLCYPVFKANAFLYHAFNLILFWLICVLFYKIVEGLFKNRELAFLTAVFYAFHPINSMLVNYVTVTVITTFVLCMQGSFLCLIKHLESGKKTLYYGSLILFAAALFSHEMSVVYPAYVLCLLYFLRGFTWRRALMFVIPYVALSGLYLWYRMFFFSLKGQASAVLSMLGVFDAYISSVMALIYWYIGKLFVPIDPLMLWTVVIEQQFSIWEKFRVLLLGVLIVYLIFFRWKKGLKAFALSVFVLGLLPTFVASYAHFPFAEPMIEPHWFYFSSIGFFILLAQAFLLLKEKFSYQVFAVCVVLCLGVYNFFLQKTHLQWRSQESYCRYWIAVNPLNATPFYGLGQVALAQGNADAAVGYLQKTLEITRYKSAFITADLGYAYYLQGQFDQAIPMFQSALMTDPEYSVTYYYIALLQWRVGNLEAGESFLLKAQELYAKSNLYSRQLNRLRSGEPPVAVYPLMYLEGL